MSTKKWKDMTLAEKEEYLRANPSKSSGMKLKTALLLVGTIILMVLVIAKCTDDSPKTEVKIKKAIPYDSLSYDQKDSTLRKWSASTKYEVPGLVKQNLMDQDADVDVPNNFFIVDVDEKWCRYSGVGTAKNGFGVRMKFSYAVDFYISKDSIQIKKVDITQ